MDKAFEFLNDNDRALLEKKGEVLEVEKDYVILEEGESRRVLFVILEGSCRVELPRGRFLAYLFLRKIHRAQIKPEFHGILFRFICQ